MVPLYIAQGFSQGVMPLISYNYASKNIRRMKQTIGLSFALPFLVLDFLAVGVFTACGMGRRTFVFAILRKIILEIPALFILDRMFSLYGLAYAQFKAELILSAAAVIILTRYLKN